MSECEDIRNRKAIALLSGGLDSVVALAEVRQIHDVILALTFSYGQKVLQQEINAAESIAAHYQIPHQVIDLNWYPDLLPDYYQNPLNPDEEKTTASVWVPNRNGVFLNIAAAVAEAQQANVIIYGANADEAMGFPDNTPLFRERLNRALKLSTLRRVQVVAPVEALTKVEIIQRGVELNAPLEKIWSCYEPGDKHCGQCMSCELLKKSLAAAGQELIPFLDS